MTPAVDGGRDAFRRREWRAAHTLLSTADAQTPLEPADLELLATAAYLVGDDTGSDATWGRAHRDAARIGEVERAARCAFWLGLSLLLRGEGARGSGWLARAERILDENGLDCPVRGYLLVPAALDRLGHGEAAEAYLMFEQVGAVGDRFADDDLSAVSRLGRGQSLVAQGDVARGLPWLDDAMIAVTEGEVTPMIAGIVYCAVIEACLDISDLRRATEWTAALHDWCAAQPDLVPYRGQCLVHRAELLQLHGAWSDAMHEAALARVRLSEPPHPALGMAVYQEAELHRLAGRFDEAEQAYREAGRCGRDPVPGLALLQLAQGRGDTAKATIQRMLDEAPHPLARAKVLPAYVEIMLAGDEIAAARQAADELGAIARLLDAPLLEAAAIQARGVVLLAEGEARVALTALRDAWSAWRGLAAPYEAARAHMLIGLACRAVGDEDSALVAFEAAADTFDQLGAGPDRGRVDALRQPEPPGVPAGLTDREVEVLRLVAAGHTNREIGSTLAISPHTAARHVQNIFTKLGVSSRAAATAFAYEHDLV